MLKYKEKKYNLTVNKSRMSEWEWWQGSWKWEEGGMREDGKVRYKHACMHVPFLSSCRVDCFMCLSSWTERAIKTLQSLLGSIHKNPQVGFCRSQTTTSTEKDK